MSLLSDPGLPHRRRAGAETSRFSYGLNGEGVLVRVRTYGFRVFYEAARDLDSPPSPRTDRVEACRPRECCPSQSSGDKKSDAAPGRF